jgi:hypothetical protein
LGLALGTAVIRVLGTAASYPSHDNTLYPKKSHS